MAASDAAQLKSAHEDIKEILKTTYCHSILAAARRRAHGPNELLDHPGHSVLQLVAQQFEDTLVRIPLAAGAVSFALTLSSSAGALTLAAVGIWKYQRQRARLASMVGALWRSWARSSTRYQARRRQTVQHQGDRSPIRRSSILRRAICLRPIRSNLTLRPSGLQYKMHCYNQAALRRRLHRRPLPRPERLLPPRQGKVHGGRLNFRVFHWIASLLPAKLFGIGTVSSSPSSAPCLLSSVALMILVAFEPRLWCGSMAIVPWLSG
ncbi:hypothetical protein ZWY2020_006878 [Hordeum vulgare]|nr:hypothetical protein ZWY2020_006878 [Hordeum vulgare]